MLYLLHGTLIIETEVKWSGSASLLSILEASEQVHGFERDNVTVKLEVHTTWDIKHSLFFSVNSYIVNVFPSEILKRLRVKKRFMLYCESKLFNVFVQQINISTD